MIKNILTQISIIVLAISFFSCQENENKVHASLGAVEDCGSMKGKTTACAGCPSNKAEEIAVGENSRKNTGNSLITFVELGSVNCIPCKQMQPVMKAIGDKYGDQIEVVFYDVWKPEESKYAKEYGIRLIPTQVFLDKEGKELFRHEGFFPEESIDKFLTEQGLSPKEKS